jgi:signal transduction histidine kinase/ActR/RegA family two-component response regulator
MKQFQQSLERVLSGEAITGLQVERRRRDGRRIDVRICAAPTRDPAGVIDGVIALVEDVTERKNLGEQLRQAQKMEAIGQLTGGIAHDFNNFLGIIMGNLDLLRERAAGDPTATRLVDAALRGATRSADLTQSLLAFSRRQPLDPKLTNVSERLGMALDLLKRSLGEAVSVVPDLAPAPWTVRIDGAQFDSCILNLANNARDAMADGGTLRVTTRNVRLDEAYAAANPGAAAGDYVMIEVTDTGTGMAQETAARAFEPFFTTKDTGHGTGLGLSMVYGFVKQSGGHISLYSEPGQGTTVRLYLPRDRHAGLTILAEAGPPARPMPTGRETVLVVEDNEPLRQTAVAQLTSLGYRVVEAENGQAALAILDRNDQALDLLFTDVVMPGEPDGFGLARMARERRPGIGVLITSGFPGDALNRNGGDMDLPMLGKPYRKDELARALRAAIDAPRQGAI